MTAYFLSTLNNTMMMMINNNNHLITLTEKESQRSNVICSWWNKVNFTANIHFIHSLISL